MISISGASGMGGFNSQLNQILREMGETKQIVTDIYKKLNEFKDRINKNMAEDAIKKAEAKIEKLKNKIKTMAPRLNGDVKQIEQLLEQLKQQLGIPL